MIDMGHRFTAGVTHVLCGLTGFSPGLFLASELTTAQESVFGVKKYIGIHI